MKNQKLIKRLAGIASAAVMAFSSAAPLAVEAAVKGRTFNEDELVRLIVTLYGEPILSLDGAEQGADFLDSDFARDRARQLENKRSSVYSEICELYPQATIDFTYDSIINGFACTVPEEFTDEIEAMPNVEDVVVSKELEKPELYDAEQYSGVNDFISGTSLTGEGQVISIIDTELNADHPMFAPLGDDVKVKLTKEDITDAIHNRGMNFELDPDRAYISSKVPFAVSYGTPDDIYSVYSDDTTLYHGSHVAGIAVGDRVSPGDDYDNKEIQGVAPDAQLIFIAACMRDGTNGIDDAAAIAGIEDSVKLGADVVSMSFGAEGQAPDSYSLYEQAIENAENAGVIVCGAAGNRGTTPVSSDSPDNCSIDSPAISPNAFSVAAGIAEAEEVYSCELSDGSSIDYFTYSFGMITSKNEVVDCGKGNESDYEGKELSGKLALVLIDDILNIEEKLQMATSHKALGVVLYTEDDELMVEDHGYYYEPAVAIKKEDAEKLKSMEEKTLEFKCDIISSYGNRSICDFSARGTKQDLTLKPEITAPGDNILSASYTGEYDVMGGTSMSTPFIAGCAALTNQYLTANSIGKRGNARVDQIKQILMNSATPIMKDNIEVSPRSQGAGMVNMASLMNDKVIMKGSSGKAVIELGDMLQQSFSFDVTIENISDEDVVFDHPNISLTTDKCEYPDAEALICGDASPVRCDIECESDILSIAAGEEKTVRINVVIDAEDYDKNNATFPNGWFVDGFLYLEGAENCCDISIPILGFRGDWYAVPIFGKDDLESDSPYSNNCMCSNIAFSQVPASVSLAEMVKAQGILTDNESKWEDYEAVRYAALHHDYVVSPNYDGSFDDMVYVMLPKREGWIDSLEIYDENGERFTGVDTYGQSVLANKTTTINTLCDSYLPEGKYTAKIKAHIFADGAEERAQNMSFDFTVDTTPPKLTDISFFEKDGRKYVTMTAQDDRLEGIYIIGNGKGCVQGGELKQDTYMGILNDILVGLDRSDSSIDYDDEPKDPMPPATASTTLQDFLYNMRYKNYQSGYNFIDVISAEPDENGCMKLTYDVTDLTEYSITVADRGYNMSTFAADKPYVGAIDSVRYVNSGEKLMPDVKPDVFYDGEITSEGWELLMPYSDMWVGIDENTLVEMTTHDCFIHYYAESNGVYSYSNNMLIKVNDIYTMRVQIYENDELVSDFTATPQPFMMYGYDNTIDHKVVISADGYVTRTVWVMADDEIGGFDLYLYKKGDVNGDGSVNVTDISRVAAHSKSVKELDDYEQAVANVNEDDVVNVTDISKLAAYVKGIKDL